MSEIINLNNATPAAPTGHQNVSWQKSSTSSGTDSTTGLPIYPVSANIPTPVTLEVNGTANGSQELLNLAAGSNMTLTDNGTGTVTLAALSGGAVNYQTGQGYSLVSTDKGSLIALAGTYGYVDVIVPSTLAADFYCQVMVVSGTGTFTPTSGTVNGLSAITLAAEQGGWLFFDGTNWTLAAIGGNGVGGTANLNGNGYTPTISAQGTLLRCNGSSGYIDLTLPATLGSSFCCAVYAQTGIVNLIAPTSSLINGFSSITLTTGQSGWLFWDGTNWEMVLGAIDTSGGVSLVTSGNGCSLTNANKGELLVFSGSYGYIDVSMPSTLNSGFYCAMYVSGGVANLTPAPGVTINGLSASTPYPVMTLTAGQYAWVFWDGTNWEAMIGGGVVTTTAAIVSALPGKPASGQEVLIWAVDRATTFPANFSGSVGGFGPNGAHPTATAVYTVYNNSTQVGTITISTSGGFTFATTSGAVVTPSVGSVFSIVAPGTQDATMASVALTLQAQRTL